MTDTPLDMPLPLDALGGNLRRFCDPQAPGPARLMAARGLVPIKGADQLTVLAQLSADADANVASTADKTLREMPDDVLAPGCEQPLHAAVLDRLARALGEREEALARIAANPETADATLEGIARGASEALCERLAVNEQRLLRAPRVIEALYKNRNMRMSTADRLVELAARNGVELHGIAAFKDHVEAIKGQLMPEPSDEPLPGDDLFRETLQADADEEAIEQDEAEGTESVKAKYQPLATRIGDMTKGEKLRLAIIGNAAARALLLRDSDRQVAMAAVQSPKLTVKEAAELAASRSVAEEVLRYLGNKREFMNSQELKTALVFNPKTPLGISLRYLSHLRPNQLRTLARSRNVAGQIKSAAMQHLQRRSQR